jgi:hypothetical protein
MCSGSVCFAQATSPPAPSETKNILGDLRLLLLLGGIALWVRLILEVETPNVFVCVRCEWLSWSQRS